MSYANVVLGRSRSTTCDLCPFRLRTMMPEHERTWREAVARLPRFGSGIGLHRVASLAAPLLRSAWGQRIDAIKITGSNGKGSVASMTASILEAAGVTTGLFTSPHVRALAERIQIGLVPISDRDADSSYAWCAARWRRYAAVHGDEAIGSFEMLLATAWHAFARAKVECVVAEVGIGGRFDPVRLLPGNVSVLTSIDDEHAALLGPTLEAIARDKADVAAKGTTLLVGPVPPAVRAALEHHTDVRGVRSWFLDDPMTIRANAPDPAGTVAHFELDGARHDDVRIAAHGAHQVPNAALAITLARRWLRANRPGLGRVAWRRAILRGLSSLSLPGRFEWLSRQPPVLTDIAHTPAATRALAATLRRHLGPHPFILVAGVSADKDAEALLAPLIDRSAQVVATRALHRGGPTAAVVSAVLGRRPHVPCVEEASLPEALNRAMAWARDEGRTVVIAGGLFLAAEAAKILATRSSPLG